jgi:hypothetical protein
MFSRLVRRAAAAGGMCRAFDAHNGLAGISIGSRAFTASNKADVQKVVAVLYRAGDAAKELKLLGECTLKGLVDKGVGKRNYRTKFCYFMSLSTLVYLFPSHLTRLPATST